MLLKIADIADPLRRCTRKLKIHNCKGMLYLDQVNFDFEMYSKLNILSRDPQSP